MIIRLNDSWKKNKDLQIKWSYRYWKLVSCFVKITFFISIRFVNRTLFPSSIVYYCTPSTRFLNMVWLCWSSWESNIKRVPHRKWTRLSELNQRNTLLFFVKATLLIWLTTCARMMIAQPQKKLIQELVFSNIIIFGSGHHETAVILCLIWFAH